MDLQGIARLGQANKALAEVMQHCLMDAPKELQKLEELTQKLIQILFYLASAFVEMYDAFQEDGAEDLPSWFHCVAKEVVFDIDTMFDLRTLQKTIVRSMTENERQRFNDGEKFAISPEDTAKIIEHLLQRI